MQENYVLKRSMTGLETEFHIIDQEGKISNRAGDFVDLINSRSERAFVTKEIGKSMIEFNSYPDVKTFNPALDIIKCMQNANDELEKEGLRMLPLGAYPGRFEPEMNETPTYNIKKKIFGEDKSKILGRCVSFHHHYTLPRGVFDPGNKQLRMMKRSKLTRSMVSSYNFEIAADPALTLFAQSSPFYHGMNLARDSRVLAYRGGAKLRFMNGAYSNMQQMGGLPPYKQTVSDLMLSLSNRWNRWQKLVKKADPTASFRELYPYRLDISWNPVKINKHGTLEQRGMDINYMSTITAVTILLKFCLKKIQRDFIEVIPTDFAIDEPFRIENGMLYIPPHTYVRNKLQPWSAYYGYKKKEMHKYAKNFLTMARHLTPKRYNPIIRPIIDMVDKKKSLSDKVIEYSKRKGYFNEGVISDEDSAKLALHYAGKFPKDLEKTRKNLNKIATL